MVWEGISLDTDLLRGSPSPLTIRPCDGALVSEFLLLRDIAQSDAASVLDDKDINATGVSPESNPSVDCPGADWGPNPGLPEHHPCFDQVYCVLNLSNFTCVSSNLPDLTVVKPPQHHDEGRNEDPTNGCNTSWKVMEIKNK